MKCNSCAYKNGTSCGAMKEFIENCWAYADSKEKSKRESAIRKYSGKQFGRD